MTVMAISAQRVMAATVTKRYIPVPQRKKSADADFFYRNGLKKLGQTTLKFSNEGIDIGTTDIGMSD